MDVGFIGLGRMGQAMAGSLLRAPLDAQTLARKLGLVAAGPGPQGAQPPKSPR
jgi:3-hydroxyisobutyrate dehydrogenase-like beta-hydroxyacid dehydrogenase